MHFQLSILSLAVISVPIAQACLTAHTYMNNCFLTGDIMSVQVWDNGNEVCKTGQTKNGAGDSTVYSMNCGNGYTVDVTNNGRSVTVHNSAGTFNLQEVNGQGPNTFTCAETDSSTFHGTEYETVLSDHFGNCGSFPQPGLCDYRSFC